MIKPPINNWILRVVNQQNEWFGTPGGSLLESAKALGWVWSLGIGPPAKPYGGHPLKTLCTEPAHPQVSQVKKLRAPSLVQLGDKGQEERGGFLEIQTGVAFQK